MSKLLRILVVEDSEPDAILLARAFRDAGYEPQFLRVDTAAEMEAALDAQTWDVILSDFSLPQFNGADALLLCQKRNLDIPFIIVSGRIGEETAVEMMRAGAHDYLMKDQLTRLAPVVERELRAAQERRVRRETEQARAHLASIVECCDDAIISKSLDGKILSWNAGAERMYGYTAEEIIGHSMALLIPPERTNEAAEILDFVEENKNIERFETVRLRKDGTMVDVSQTISPIRDTNGAIHSVAIVARDITQRKQQEKERLKLIEQLRSVLAQVKTLRGLLPICASCKKIRNDEGYWEQVETYIRRFSDAEFTHGICPECMKQLYPDYHFSPLPR